MNKLLGEAHHSAHDTEANSQAAAAHNGPLGACPPHHELENEIDLLVTGT